MHPWQAKEADVTIMISRLIINVTIITIINIFNMFNFPHTFIPDFGLGNAQFGIGGL